MGDFNPLKTFEQAFEKGLSGKINNFELWLKEKNIESAKLSTYAIEQYFFSNINKVIVFEKELKSIAEIIGYYSKERQDIISISLIGVDGIGKTFFAKILEKIIQKSTFNIPSYLIQCESLENEDYYNEFLKKLTQNYELLILDNCNEDRNIIEGTIKKISQKIKAGIILSIWTPENYNQNQIELEKLFEFNNEFYLNPYSYNQSKNILLEILQFFSMDLRKQGTEKYLKEIYKYSSGIPKNFIKFVINAIKTQFYRGFETWNQDLVENVARQMFLTHKKKIIDLTDIQKRILYFILISNDKLGIRPMSLIDLLGLNKATISYHLTNLKEVNLIKSERMGRSVFYSIVPELKPYIQIHLSQEGEFYS